MTNTKFDDIAKNDPDFNRGRIEFEKELNELLETKTWSEILVLMTNNESEAE